MVIPGGNAWTSLKLDEHTFTLLLPQRVIPGGNAWTSLKLKLRKKSVLRLAGVIPGGNAWTSLKPGNRTFAIEHAKSHSGR